MGIQLTQEQANEIRQRPVNCHRCCEMIYHDDKYSVMAQPFASADPEYGGRMEVYFFCDRCNAIVTDVMLEAGVPPANGGDLRIGHRIEDEPE